MSRTKKVPTTKAIELILDDLMAIDEIAIEAQKLARASRTPSATYYSEDPRVHLPFSLSPSSLAMNL